MMNDVAEFESDAIDIEIQLLLEAVFIKYGHDFRAYSRAHMKRRILRRLTLSNLKDITDMIHLLLNDPGFFQLLLSDFSIHVTEMFRDPTFYQAIKDEVIPILDTYPFFNIWNAGCSTGEEVYSMAILLKEAGLYDRAQIYATDFNEEILKKAKSGIYSVDNIKDFTFNYQLSGGKSTFSDYYVVKGDYAIIDQTLKKNIIYANHNLVTDHSFGEMNIIMCRNVLIYFNRDLQNRVIKLFYGSLRNGGLLCLGSKESLRFTEVSDQFDPVNNTERIFQKKYDMNGLSRKM